jgi:hypothetical protein
MVYNDAPLAGEARCRHCAQWFAFVCDYPIWMSLCHWVFIPIDTPLEEWTDEVEPPHCYANAARSAVEWLSVVEDGRGLGPPVVRRRSSAPKTSSARLRQAVVLHERGGLAGAS